MPVYGHGAQGIGITPDYLSAERLGLGSTLKYELMKFSHKNFRTRSDGSSEDTTAQLRVDRDFEDLTCSVKTGIAHYA